jgi:hypothetical protein
MAVGVAAVLLFGAIWPAYAQGPAVPGAGGVPLPIVQGTVSAVPYVQGVVDATVPIAQGAAVPIVQGAVGAAFGLALFQPRDAGFTDLSVTSSNSDVVQVGRIDKPREGVVDFTLQGPGVGIVTVAWRNPVENRILEANYVVASGVFVDSADRIVLSSGQTMLLAIPRVQRANAYVGGTVQPSSAVVSTSVQSVGVQLSARGVGTSLVNIELAEDDRGISHQRVVIVTVIGPGRPPVY